MPRTKSTASLPTRGQFLAKNLKHPDPQADIGGACWICRRTYNERHEPVQVSPCGCILGFHCIMVRSLSRELNANQCPSCNTVLFIKKETPTARSTRQPRQGPSNGNTTDAQSEDISWGDGLKFRDDMFADISVEDLEVCRDALVEYLQHWQAKVLREASKAPANKYNPQFWFYRLKEMLKGLHFEPLGFPRKLTNLEKQLILESSWTMVWTDIQNRRDVEDGVPEFFMRPAFEKPWFEDIDDEAWDRFAKSMLFSLQDWVAKRFRYQGQYTDEDELRASWEKACREQFLKAPWEDEAILLGRKPTGEEFDWSIKEAMEFMWPDIRERSRALLVVR